MSRSGYSDDIEDPWRWIMYRGAVKSSIRGRHGQAFLRELITALDAMPVKSLVAGELQADGEFCALGVVGQARGIDLTKLNTEDWHQMSDTFGIAPTLAREIMHENDESVDEWGWFDVEVCGPVRPFWPDWGRHTKSVRRHNDNHPAERWRSMRVWAERQVSQTLQPQRDAPSFDPSRE